MCYSPSIELQSYDQNPLSNAIARYDGAIKKERGYGLEPYPKISLAGMLPGENFKCQI